MRIFYVTTEDPTLQGDYLECACHYGLARVFGSNFIDLPKKKIMYGDFSDSPRESLHGRGFTLTGFPLSDVSNRSIQPCKDDVIVYGVIPETYGVKRRYDLEEQVGCKVVLDGHDDVRLRSEFLRDRDFLYFKRELVGEPMDWLRPINFSIPAATIRPVNLALKKKLLPLTVPKGCFEDHVEQGRGHYVFENEEDYYRDLQESWFAATCKKGGWDQLRHLEAVAAGCVVLWKDWYLRPGCCGVRNFPAVGYVGQEGLEACFEVLAGNAYYAQLNTQRAWLYQHGTCEAVATYVYGEIVKWKNR